MNKIYLLFLLTQFFVLQAFSNPGDTTISRKKYFTTRATKAVTLDGVPDEEAWNAVEWGGDFTQHEPSEGQQPSQQTSFKMLYDDTYLYIAYVCNDVSADSVIKRMGRRDEFPGDWVEINIDSYHDLRTAFSFTTSVSGVRGDEAVSNDGNNWDGNWNPIWFAKTHVNNKGWTAEIKIPFSQLRYGNEPEKVWGFQIQRRIFRKEERSVWQYIPHSSGVWVSRFGELHGIKNIPMHRQVEVAPYVTAQLDKYKKETGNPFAKGTDARLTAGVDGKIAVTNDLILDYTVNPDFGQVEADPSQVRIDGFQNFFEEQRPFFIESRNIFEYQLTGSAAGGDYDADLLFYSRRIGSSPHGYPITYGGEYVKYPQNTSILGAAKFSGKTKKGWSIGVLESITEREKAAIDNNGLKRYEVVEPLTSYFVGRLQKDIKQGKTVIGGIFTSVNRERELTNILHRSAISGGLDLQHYFKNRTYYLKGNVIFSRVAGTKEAILNTQTSFEHLFQRSGATEFHLDTNRTALTGAGGTIMFGKMGGKAGKKGQVFRFETGLTFRSPELELNDIGFMLTSNEINHFTWAGLQYQRAFSIFRNARINYNHWLRWDYSGRHTYSQWNMNTGATFTNNWQAGAGVTWNPFDISNNALRGTTAVRRLAGMGYSVYVTSDTRKKVYASASHFSFWGFDNTMRVQNPALTISYQPVNALRISLSGSYSYNYRKQDQFVSNVSYNNNMRTIVGEVNQKTLRFTGRLTYNITPDLTVQYYGQPFITRPLYGHFAYVANPLDKKLDERFHVFNSSQISYSNGLYEVDENNDGIADYSFRKPDFNFVQFRSNLIVRWEYRAGSELYLVWSQSNTADAFSELNTPVEQSLFHNAFTGDNARNIFLVKWTYRFLK